MLKISSISKEAVDFGEVAPGQERILPTNYPNISQFLQSFNQLKQHLGPQLKFFRTIGRYEQQLKDLADGKIENLKGFAALTPEGKKHQGRILTQQLEKQFQAINAQIQTMLQSKVQDTQAMANIENYLLQVLAPLQSQATERAEAAQTQQEIAAMPTTPEAKTNPHTQQIQATPEQQLEAIQGLAAESPARQEQPNVHRTWKNRLQDVGRNVGKGYRSWRDRQRNPSVADPAFADSKNKIIIANWVSKVFPD